MYNGFGTSTIVISDETTSGKFAPPYLIYVEMPKILNSSHSAEMG